MKQGLQSEQVKCESFQEVLDYLIEQEKAQLIGGNMAGKTRRVLVAEFRAARQLNPQLNKAVYHASLSLPKEPESEPLDDDRWNEIADDYVNGMGFTGSQYVVYRNGDLDHDRIDIVASRIRFIDGSTVSDSWDHPRSQALLELLEEKHELRPYFLVI
jgi:hypothetical protein